MNQIDNLMALATAYADERVMAVRGRSTKEDAVAADQALRAAVEKALAVQPKQEPVAWMHRSNDMHFMKEKPLGEIGFLFVPLYTHPKPKEETVQKPVAWEYRYKESNPHTVNYGKWGEWERLVPRNALETVEGCVAEMNRYIATGYSYEVRALYDSPLVQKGRDEALAVQPQQEPVAYITRNEEGDPSMLFFGHLEAESYCAEDEDPEPLYATPQPHRKAMQQALEALECAADYTGSAADKMAMEHKIERDRWIPMFDALQEESQALRQQLAEAQRDTVKQIADAAFRHGLSLVKTDTGFELLRLGTAIAAMKGTA